MHDEISEDNKVLGNLKMLLGMDPEDSSQDKKLNWLLDSARDVA